MQDDDEFSVYSFDPEDLEEGSANEYVIDIGMRIPNGSTKGLIFKLIKKEGNE